MTKDQNQTVAHLLLEQPKQVEQAAFAKMALVAAREAGANARTVSLFGEFDSDGVGKVAGAYVWDDDAPPGEFRHLELTADQESAVLKAMQAHVPQPVRSLEDQIRAAETVEELKVVLLRMRGVA